MEILICFKIIRPQPAVRRKAVIKQLKIFLWGFGEVNGINYFNKETIKILMERVAHIGTDIADYLADKDVFGRIKFSGSGNYYRTWNGRRGEKKK